MLRRVTAILTASLLAAAIAGCPTTNGLANAPEWVTTTSTGRFDGQAYLVGKASVRMTGDPIADARAARDEARAELLRGILVRVESDFLSHIAEYRVGNQWTESAETISRIRTSVAGTLPVAPEEEMWTDRTGRQVYMLMGVSRASYAARLRENLAEMSESHRATIDRAASLNQSGASLDALRMLGRVERALPEYLTAAASFRAVAGGAAFAATPATPARLRELRDQALSGCIVRLDVTADGQEAHVREALASVLRGAGMSVAETGSRYVLTLKVEGNTETLELAPGRPRIAIGRYGWQLTMAPAHGGNDYSFVETSTLGDSRSVQHTGPAGELARIRREAVQQAAARAGAVLAGRLAGIE